MTVGETIRWQWQDYARYHEDRGNLLLHIFAVGLFWVAALSLVIGAVRFSILTMVLAASALLISMVLQSMGHKKEANPPVPFTGKADFFKRFLSEQFVTFPRFVLTGGWFKIFFR